MSERIEQKKKKLDELYDKLVEKALADGVITPEEEVLLEKARAGIQQFKEYADQALEDNLVTVSEHTRMLKLQNKILRDAESQAMEDETITEDERELLQLLIQTVRKL